MKKPAKVQQTKGWDTEKKITFSQREKELEDDYGYITEPDLAKTVVTKADIETYQRELPALATDRVKFYMEKYKIQREDAKTISSSMALSDLYEEVTTKANPVFAAKWIRRELVRVLKYKKLKLEKTKIKADHLIEIINAVQKDTITVRVAQKLMEQLVNKPFNVAQKIKTMSGRIDDKRALEVICKKVILSNPKVVENYKDGEKNALNFLIGQVMRETKGAADPAIVSKILRSKL